MLTVDAYEQVEDSWWFLGDDFRDSKKREMITDYFDLAGVVFRGVDLEAPLGVSDVRLVPHYELVPASCLDEHGGLELGAYKGAQRRVDPDRAARRVRRAARAPARRRTRRCAALDLEVEFTGAPPALPRPRPAGRALAAGSASRRGPARSSAAAGRRPRDIVLPDALRALPFEIYIYQVGGEARRLGMANDAELAYTPWKTGAYWVLACDGPTSAS